MKVFIIFLIICTFSLNCLSQGVQFQGYGMLIEDRSSYMVFEEEVPTFDDHFSIEFNISFQDLDPFGYIFLLTNEISKKEYNLIYTNIDDDRSLLRFNNEGKENILSLEIDKSKLDNRSWLNIKCSLYPEGDSLQISIGGIKYSAKNIGLSKPFRPTLVFGKNKNSVDIPSFSIRNLSVYSEKHQYVFPLNESTGNDVHNDKGEIIGHISNPVWLINNSYYWRPRLTYHSQYVSGINYNEKVKEFFIFNKDSIFVYNIKTENHSLNSFSKPLPLSYMHLGMSFIDENNNLYAYEVWPGIDTSFAYLDNIRKEWTPLLSESISMPLHHHAGYYNAKNQEYIIFGGFGNQRYNDNFFSYKIDGNKWDTLHFSGAKIAPRFYQGISHSNTGNSLYIFGGIGNESGDQTIGRYYFYDLYKVNLDNMDIEKLWNLNWTANNIVPARNLVMHNDSIFYALCYPEYEPNSYVQLYEFSITDGSYRVLGDSILFRSDKITTNVNLYYDELLSEFYCTIQEFEDNGSSTIKLYSLSSPAVSESSLTIYQNTNKISSQLFVIICLIISGIIITYICYRRIKCQSKIQKGQTVEGNLFSKSVDSSIRPNAIYLFGEFLIYDKQGKDITYMLSTRLKYTFWVILEYSLKDEGITSHQLNKLLWPDKDEYSVKNLRGVTISQLRKVMSELEDIELIYEKGNFRFVMSGKCYCDCHRLLELIDSENRSVDKLNEINNILSRGQFLKSINEPLANSFKAFIVERIISILPVYIEDAFETENYLLTMLLCENLLTIDPLNETVFSLQIRSLCNLKQTSEAKKQYAIFTSKYQKSTNTKYPISFSSLYQV